jgi:hypothetical protein
LEDIMVERGSAKHGFAKDEELQRELDDALRNVGPTCAQSWREPELPQEEEIEELGLDGPPRSEMRRPD